MHRKIKSITPETRYRRQDERHTPITIAMWSAEREFGIDEVSSHQDSSKRFWHSVRKWLTYDFNCQGRGSEKASVSFNPLKGTLMLTLQEACLSEIPSQSR